MHEMDGTKEDLGPETFLVNVSNELEANIVESILSVHGIPTLRKQRELGSYLNITMGMSIYGIDLYVPESLVEQSQDLIGASRKLPDINGEAAEVTYVEELSDRRRIRGMFLIGMLWVFPLIIWLVVKIL